MARQQKCKVNRKMKLKKVVSSDGVEGWPNNATRLFHQWMLRDETGHQWSDIARTANAINKHRRYHSRKMDFGLVFFVDCIDDAIDHMHSMKHASGVDMLDKVVLEFLWEVDSPAIARYWMEMNGDFSGKGS